MKNEFLPYDGALKLKQLGFDEPCFGIWKDGKLISVGGHWGAGITHSMFGFEGDRFAPDECRALTFSQAFRWFREKHGLVGLIEIGTQEYSFFIFNVKTDSRKVTSSINGTYEEVELACLDKLIEIVESKKK